MKKQAFTEQAKNYQERVKTAAPKSKTLSQCVRAFVSGGIICVIGQAIRDFGAHTLFLDEKSCAAFTAITLVFLGALFTGLGIYDKIGKWAGAGSVVPITGFANSIVSPAMEFKREGLIMGTAAKLFQIAGPVLVYGICASVAIGLIKCIFSA